MSKILDIYNFIDEIAPYDSQMDFDNSGLIIGDFNDEVKKSVVSLDVTNESINECINFGATLIISHHPVIFNPLKSLKTYDIPYILVKNQISSLCAHTNLDLSPIGVNHCLFSTLKLNNKKPLSKYNGYDLGYIGTLEENISPLDFAHFVKKNLRCDHIRFTNASKSIKKVAVSSGSGGRSIFDAFYSECDALVTGEIKHNEILFANDHEISIFDVGHFNSENVVIPYLTGILKQKFSDVEFYEFNCFDKVKCIGGIVEKNNL